jgi:Xaa-Pro aminopeptidase
MQRKNHAKRVDVSTIGDDRLTRLRQLRLQLSLTHILISDPVDVAYISGFSSSNAMLLISQRKNRLFTDFRYETDAKRFCKMYPEWTFIPVESSMAEALSSFIGEGASLGFQSDKMTVDDFSRLKRHIRGVKRVSCSRQLNELLLEKEAHEIQAMKTAAETGDAALEKLLPDILPGVTETWLAARLESYCRELGSEKPSFDTIVLFGSRSALPHGKPGKTVLKKGAFILFDFGCTVDGFASDMTRTMVAGRASPKQRMIHEIVQEAQETACREARAGMRAKAIDALARDPITAAGYGDFFGHALGHGVGRRIHEPPRVSGRIPLKLPENTVITIEPGIYLPAFGGVRIEDMIVLQPDSAQRLTHFPRELMEL